MNKINNDRKYNLWGKIILFLILLFSVIGMIFFILPMKKGIINIGNLSGLFASFFVLIICIFENKFLKIFSFLWGKSAGRIVIIFLSMLIILGIIFAMIFSILMLRAMNNYPKQPNVLVVLGCKVKGTQPSQMLQRRLDVTYKYLLGNPEVVCIVTGGQGADEKIPEAQAMKDYLLRKGIKENRIFVEDKSTSTYENFEFSKDIIEVNNLGNNITIVTDGFHQYRASIIAKKLGFSSKSLPVDTKTYLMPTYWVREWFGIAYVYLA